MSVIEREQEKKVVLDEIFIFDFFLNKNIKFCFGCGAPGFTDMMMGPSRPSRNAILSTFLSYAPLYFVAAIFCVLCPAIF